MTRSLFLTLVFLVGCSKPDVWIAFVYPDIDNMPGPESSHLYIIGQFETFEACQSSAIGQVRINQSSTGKVGTYVCGLNCERKPEFTNMLVCKEKRK
jgi:hypothetical protein